MRLWETAASATGCRLLYTPRSSLCMTPTCSGSGCCHRPCKCTCGGALCRLPPVPPFLQDSLKRDNGGVPAGVAVGVRFAASRVLWLLVCSGLINNKANKTKTSDVAYTERVLIVTQSTYRTVCLPTGVNKKKYGIKSRAMLLLTSC